jgi:uncharacterized protein
VAAQLSPPIESPSVENGYLLIPTSYTSQTSSFSITIGGFQPRFISPHPYTNQNTLAIARGPIVYCVEDVDNPKESNHFKDITVTANAKVVEEDRDYGDEKFVGLKTSGRARRLDSWAAKQNGLEPGSSLAPSELGEDVELAFVPYYLRANRGGNGHMRVGIGRSQ